MDKKTQANAIYVILGLMVIATFAIDNHVVQFLALGGLLFIGVVVESTKTKDK